MNKARWTRIAIVGAVLTLGGGAALATCSRASESAPAAALIAPTQASPAATQGVPQGAAPSVTHGVPTAGNRALVVTMSLELVVTDVDRALSSIRGIVERSGGYVGDARAEGTGDGRHAHLVLRVPTNMASDVRGSLGALGVVRADNESAVDVTEEHADLQARLTNARVQELRVLEIMKSHTGSLADLLGTEAELARIREVIERLEAQKLTLDRTIDLATVQVDLTMPAAALAPAAPIPSFDDTPVASIVLAGKNGLHAAKVMLVSIAMVLATILPFLLPLLGLGYAALRLAHRRALRAAPTAAAR